MSTACRAFRSRLEALLIGSSEPFELTALGWHEHLYGCDDCRELLQAEEALEVLLTGLPDPVLPRDLAERLLRRLAPARARGLDALLELDRADAPPDLAGRMLAGLQPLRRLDRARAEARLDSLLDAVPAPTAPPGLSRSVLRGLEPHRRTSGAPSELPTSRPRPLRPVRSGRPLPRVRAAGPALLAAAAVVLAVAGAYVWWPSPPEQRLGAEQEGPVAALPAPVPDAAGDPTAEELALPDAELLASLDLLEDWELLNGDDVDLLLATLGAPDELLLQDADESASGDPATTAPPADEPTTRKRG